MDVCTCNFFLLSVALWYMPAIDAVLRLMDPNGTEIISHVIAVTDKSAFRDNVREAFVSWSLLFFFIYMYLVYIEDSGFLMFAALVHLVPSSWFNTNIFYAMLYILQCLF